MSRMTNVITVYQPYASLIMAGVKTWETRGNPPNGDMRPEGVRGLPGRRINAGDRILIHAANRPITFADCERFNTIDPLSNVQLGWVDGDPALYFRDDMVETSFEAGAWTSGNTFEISMTFGAILGSVRVADALPIAGEDGPIETLQIVASDDSLTLWHPACGAPGDEADERDISDQLPFGNWTPGGWAWGLADPIPTTLWCPACDGTGWILDCDACRESGKSLADTDCSASGCRVCKRTGSCQPIPVTGKQGVWEWK